MTLGRQDLLRPKCRRRRRRRRRRRSLQARGRGSKNGGGHVYLFLLQRICVLYARSILFCVTK